MANTRHTYHLHSKEVEEIIRNNGLPDEISTETQLWDLIIKKATYSSPKLLFPLIYEIYGKDYPKDSTVVPLLFFASTFWTKLQNIFGHYCKSKLDKVAKPRLAAILPAA